VKIRAWLLLALGLLLTRPATLLAADEGDRTTSSSKPRPFKVTFYPILVHAPIFGAAVDLPTIPGGGGGEAGDQSGTTDFSLNSALMTGVSVEADRWFAEFDALWAAVSAEHSTPRVSVDSDLYFYKGRGGVRLFDGLSATAGFRRVTLGLHASLALPTGAVIDGAVKPGVLDPLIGVDWRGSLGDDWSLDADFEGGGFGVGADIDLGGDIYADWQFASHFALRLGYTLVHFRLTVDNVNIGSFQRTLVATQTLHGPVLGFGIVF